MALTVKEVSSQATILRYNQTELNKNYNKMYSHLRFICTTLRSQDTKLSETCSGLSNDYVHICSSICRNLDALTKLMENWARNTTTNENEAVKDITSVNNINREILESLRTLISKN